jgi:hypothetical protein
MDLCRFKSRLGSIRFNSPLESGGLLCFEQFFFFQKQKKKQTKKKRKNIDEPVGAKMQGCPLTDIIDSFLSLLKRDTRSGLAFYHQARHVWRLAKLVFFFDF